ncbi:hypothetical protein H0H87_008035 [Tephrocybe sp. NHM501043]|nr:hypothetical protein H0H87_008035 [Tephrocybe sp. NHM501043]
MDTFHNKNHPKYTSMTILLTGGTGKTALPTARRLQEAGHSVLLANRSGKAPSPYKGVAFDWFDPTTFENPFVLDKTIDRVYLVFPNTFDRPKTETVLDVVRPFVELSISKGVKRFVFLSSTLHKRGETPMGKVHEYLENRGVDWSVLRPTWFMENLALLYPKSICESNSIPTTMGNGRVPYIAVDDVSELVYQALVDEKSHNIEHIVLGPDAYTHDEVAAIFSKILGREIGHTRLTEEQGVDFWRTFGAPEPAAKFMVAVEQLTANGSEYALFKEPLEGKVIGTTRLVDYIEANADLWKS